MKKEIQKYNINKPTEISIMAIVVKNYIIKNNLFVSIAGKNYVMVEGWQFAGGLMGLFPKVIKVENIAKDKWLAQVDIIREKDGRIVSTGFALCSKDELKKKSFDEYAILSMAQTRAIGKAFRNLIGWIMKLAGYEGTPAEEIKGIKEKKAAPTETNGTDHIQKLKAELFKMGAKNEKEAIELLQKKSGLLIKNFDISQKHAQIALFNLLNAKK